MKPGIFKAKPRENITLHRAFNWSGTVYVAMFVTDVGDEAAASFWSIKEFWNKKRGRFTRTARFEISGFRDELRAGELDAPTTFFVTADGGVWRSMSDKTYWTLMDLFDRN